MPRLALGAFFVLVAAIAISAPSSVLTQSVNPCETPDSCCFDIDWERTPGSAGLALNESYELSQTRAQSPWGDLSGMGIEIALDETVTRPGTSSWRYPIALLNSSAIPTSAEWSGLTNSEEKLVLVPADSMTPILRPLRGNWKLHVKFARHFACLEKVTLLRTVTLTYRQGASIDVYDAFGQRLDRQDFPWSLHVSGSRIDAQYSVSSVSRVTVQFSGYGYGALASLRACFPGLRKDRCGVCGGDNSSCPAVPVGPQANQTCRNESMSNPLCVEGHYSANLTCVPDRFGLEPEICNGIDDDCDGLIDEEGVVPVVLECGVGECFRRVLLCGDANTTANATCIPGQPRAEVCDGLDNDCDGLVDEGDVCARPVEGVAIVPAFRCVSGRLNPSSGCRAHFGYTNRDPKFDVTLAYPGPKSEIRVDGGSPAFNASSLVGVIPTHFARNSSSADAFSVPIPCANSSEREVAVTWRIGDGAGHHLEDTGYVSSAQPCESYVSPHRPISVYVDDTCVHVANDECTVRFGYFSPNDAPTYIALGALANAFSGASNISVTPPTAFFPARVRAAVSVRWNCPSGREGLSWTLSSANATRTAVASSFCPEIHHPSSR